MQQFEDLKPGSMTAELAAALGLSGPLDPPPWLARMLALGQPPAYSRPVGDTGGPGASAAAAGGDEEVFVIDDGEEQLELVELDSSAAATAEVAFPGGLPGGERLRA